MSDQAKPVTAAESTNSELALQGVASLLETFINNTPDGEQKVMTYQAIWLCYTITIVGIAVVEALKKSSNTQKPLNFDQGGAV